MSRISEQLNRIATGAAGWLRPASASASDMALFDGPEIAEIKATPGFVVEDEHTIWRVDRHWIDAVLVRRIGEP